MIRSLLVVLVAIFSLSVQAQNLKTITDLEDKNQQCLDKGGYMLGCSKKFYLQMDSLLNVVYNQARRSMSEADKANLKKEQVQWLGKRDAFFDKQTKELKRKYDAGTGGQDDAMFVYDEEAEFVKKRVIELVQRYLHN